MFNRPLSFIPVFVIGFSLFLRVPALGDEPSITEDETPKVESPGSDRVTRRECLAFFKFVAAITGIGAAATLKSSERHGYFLPQYYRGAPHIGFGIYLDVDRIETLLTSDEKKILKTFLDLKGTGSAYAASIPVVEMFGRKIFGDYDENMAKPRGGLFSLEREDYSYRMASTFFQGQSCERGVCRHKAAILAELLGHYGIDAVTESGTVRSSSSPGGTAGHGWVVVRWPNKPDYCVDPTNGVFTPIPAADFYSGMEVISVRRRDIRNEDFNLPPRPAHPPK